MTSESALAQFAELSPEKRQLLFEKIRQKKLSEARRPTEGVNTPSQNAYIASPQQATLFERFHDQQLSNRLLDIEVEGNLSASILQQAILDLAPHFPALTTRLDSESNQFAQASESVTLDLIDLTGNADSDLTIQALKSTLDKLKLLSNENQCLHMALVQCSNDKSHFLLAAHPLLLDSYSLLRLANQLLSLVSGAIDLAVLKPKESCTQYHFATWSEQVLEKKFLRNEWSRVAPPSLSEAELQPIILQGECHRHFIADDFIQQHSQNQSSAKQWLCNALHQCLSSWITYNDVTYWFSDPLLKDSAFDNLLGFFPYYVPVKPKSDDEQEFNISAQLSQLHTHYCAVSEHLANQLCSTGSQVPFLHYHWFDLGNSEEQPFQIIDIQHHNSGVMLSPIEIHVTELASGISLNVHFDPQKLGQDQAAFLMRELMAMLKQDVEIDPAKRPSLPEQLRAIWKELLQVSEIAPLQSFFELGGHSLQVTEMKFRIKQQLKVDIPISVLYELPTIESLSNFILATHGNSLGITADSSPDEDLEEEEGTL